jgi:hypothetical protein
MRFQFDAKASDGLRVLPEIPHVTPCLIEGRNGIGKTVAVRLLELIAGRQPFSGFDRQWHSLRQRLGRTVVRIDDLRDGEHVEFVFTPESWDPEGKAPLELGAWLGEARINGDLVAVADAQRLLWVERFAGNEDLDDTLRRRTLIYADHADRTSRAVAAAVGQLTTVLDPLRVELVAIDPAELAEANRQLGLAETEEKSSRLELARLVEEHELALDAIRARDRLRAAEDPAQGSKDRLAELQARLKARNDERAELEARIEKTQAELGRQGDPQATLGDAQRAVRFRRKRLRNIEADIDRLSAQLAVKPESETVAAALADARKALDVLDDRRRALDAGGMTSRLIDTVSSFLTGADAQGLDDEVLIELPDHQLSVAQTRDGMARRREHLRGEPKADELDTLAHETGQLRRRLAQLGDLAGQLDEAGKVRERLVDAEREEQQAEVAVKQAGHRDEQYRSDNQRLGAVEEEIDGVNEQITEVHIQLGLEGGQSPEDARADLVKQLEALAIESAEELDEHERAQREDVDRTRVRVQRAAERVTALRRSVTVLGASIDAAVASLRAEDRFTWVQGLLQDGQASEIESFARLRTGVLRLVEQLEETRNLVQVVGQFAAGALENPKMISDVELYKAVRAVLGNELLRSLDTEPVRERLFGGSRVESVDLGARELVLARNGGPSLPRPFDTFSTGEQAFAFTQARILELEPSDRPNRLLVLDEFGAFVAADRMPDLADFLRSEGVAPIADQVLVVLPLQIDYEAEIEDTTGALRERYEERVKQLRDRDYYTQQLEA